MDFEAQKEWLEKHPGIRYMISYAQSQIIFWRETKSRRIIKTEAYSLTREELGEAMDELVPLLDKYYSKFARGEKE